MTIHTRRAPFWLTITPPAYPRRTIAVLWLIGIALWLLESKVVRIVLAEVITGALFVLACYLLGVTGVMQGGR